MEDMFAEHASEEQVEHLRRCTYGGRPFGGDEFIASLENAFGRRWRRENSAKKLAKAA